MRKAFVFDFDDTLATTDCRVIVRGGKSGRMPVKRLTPSEFNDYELPFDCEFDFSEFRSENFIRCANPTFLMSLAKEVHDEGHAVYILTARADNVASAIASFLAGFNIKPVGICCVGSDTKRVDIAAEKKKTLDTLSWAFDLVYFYDDCEENCKLAREVSGIKVYLV